LSLRLTPRDGERMSGVAHGVVLESCIRGTASDKTTGFRFRSFSHGAQSGEAAVRGNPKGLLNRHTRAYVREPIGNGGHMYDSATKRTCEPPQSVLTEPKNRRKAASRLGRTPHSKPGLLPCAHAVGIRLRAERSQPQPGWARPRRTIRRRQGHPTRRRGRILGCDNECTSVARRRSGLPVQGSSQEPAGREASCRGIRSALVLTTSRRDAKESRLARLFFCTRSSQQRQRPSTRSTRSSQSLNAKADPPESGACPAS